MSRILFSDEERRRLHQEIDKVLDKPGLHAVSLTVAAFQDDGADVTDILKGEVCRAAVMDVGLAHLLDKCRAESDACPILRREITAIHAAVEYLRHLGQKYDCADDGARCPEVRQ